MPTTKNKPKTILLFIAGVLFIVFTYLAWRQFIIRFSPKKDQSVTPLQSAIEGEYSCLPNKPTDGAVTLECALGLKGDDGNYYALDMTGQDPTMSSVIQIGQKMKVDGPLLLITDQNSWALKKYDIRGVLKVEKLKLIR